MFGRIDNLRVVVRPGHDAEELATERLSLCRPTPADLDAIFAITANPQSTMHNPSDAITTRREAKELFRRWDEQWQRYRFGYWTVRPLGQATVLGFCGIKVMQFHAESVLNLFYRFDPSVWGHGIASEAARAAVRWAGDHVPAYTTIARVRPANRASQRVALNAGLIRAEHLDGDGFDGLDWIYTSPRRLQSRLPGAW
jgi:[ribosomal protein S5]-alanine N-acetyltransferase